MTTTLKTCHKCGRRYQAWRCPNCYKGHSHHSAGGSTFSRRGGAASVLGHNWGEYDAVMGRVVEEVNTWEPIVEMLQADADQVAAAFNARHAGDDMQAILDRARAAGNRDAAMNNRWKSEGAAG